MYTCFVLSIQLAFFLALCVSESGLKENKETNSSNFALFEHKPCQILFCLNTSLVKSCFEHQPCQILFCWIPAFSNPALSEYQPCQTLLCLNTSIVKPCFVGAGRPCQTMLCLNTRTLVWIFFFYIQSVPLSVTNDVWCCQFRYPLLTVFGAVSRVIRH